MTRKQFEKVVAEALDGLPDDIAERLDNVIVEVREEPTRKELEESEMDPDEVLYGLYVGVPRTERGDDSVPLLPDRVLVFQRPLERDFPDRKELLEEIRKTVLHEIGHHFGMGEDDLEDLGFG